MNFRLELEIKKEHLLSKYNHRNLKNYVNNVCYLFQYLVLNYNQIKQMYFKSK